MVYRLMNLLYALGFWLREAVDPATATQFCMVGWPTVGFVRAFALSPPMAGVLLSLCDSKRLITNNYEL